MDAFVTEFTTGVTGAALWGALAPAAAIVTVGVIVGFGYTVLRRAVNGLGKGKGKI